MEKTIKDDLNRTVVYSKLLDDNTLLEYSLKDDMFYITIRYIEMNAIREQFLKVLKKDEVVDIGETVEFSKDGTAIAIFNKTDDGYQLRGVYDLEEHTYEISDFMDIAYDKKFDKKLNKRLIK